MRRLLIVDYPEKRDEAFLGRSVGPGENLDDPTVKVNEGKEKVNEAPVIKEGFPLILTSRSSSIRRKVEKHEETLREMREKWVQFESFGLELLGSGPVLQPHWNVTDNRSVLGSSVGALR
ncbi:hypothetical protein Salat_1876400 [Sesamum alatum]|uniref:Uncharacterized protein n=1 Tax=Sesamum alatum TaxID=300844 RepID=A0AAE1Y4G9_9LAMI|nr:hypothetical protein Salat_1876400 [Sesamum alatum]